MLEKVLIAGGGIAGLSAGLVLARTGASVQILERAPELTEVGAGIQLGPNVTRILNAWGLSTAMQKVASYPANLRARRVSTGEVLATLPLADMSTRYGAPYLTIHRADLQNVLLHAARVSGVHVQCDSLVKNVQQDSQQVCATVSLGEAVVGANQVLSTRAQERTTKEYGNAFVIADGVWSTLRQQLLGDGLPRMTGHLAYRALVAQTDLPAHLRSQDVSVWMGPKVHVVQYPVRGGEWLNVVCLTEGQMYGVAIQDLQDWNLSKSLTEARADLQSALTGACTHLQALVDACGDWHLWSLYDRPPIQNAAQHAQGRVALVGDAAHPMRPYLAQGAGMAIEDAVELANQWTTFAHQDVRQRFAAFAQARWQRNARVQARAIRNGEIFHATGPMQWARDVGLRSVGKRLMDIPWLYGYLSV